MLVNQTLDFVDGVFSSKVFHLAFCSASTEDAIRGKDELVSGDHRSTACAKDAERLVCAGFNADGTVTIKGLTVSSLEEMFSLHLIEVPTCVRVARKRPILAVGFADGALNPVSFWDDRWADGCGGHGWSSWFGGLTILRASFLSRVFFALDVFCTTASSTRLND